MRVTAEVRAKAMRRGPSVTGPSPSVQLGTPGCARVHGRAQACTRAACGRSRCTLGGGTRGVFAVPRTGYGKVRTHGAGRHGGVTSPPAGARTRAPPPGRDRPPPQGTEARRPAEVPRTAPTLRRRLQPGADVRVLAAVTAGVDAPASAPAAARRRRSGDPLPGPPGRRSAFVRRPLPAAVVPPRAPAAHGVRPTLPTPTRPLPQLTTASYLPSGVVVDGAIVPVKVPSSSPAGTVT